MNAARLFRLLCLSLDITQKEMFEATGVSQPTFSRWIKGEGKISAQAVFSMATFFAERAVNGPSIRVAEQILEICRQGMMK